MVGAAVAGQSIVKTSTLNMFDSVERINNTKGIGCKTKASAGQEIDADTDTNHISSVGRPVFTRLAIESIGTAAAG